MTNEGPGNRPFTVMEVAGTAMQTQKLHQRGAILCNEARIHSYAQAQGGVEVFALVESNRGG